MQRGCVLESTLEEGWCENWEQRCLSDLFEENPDRKVLNTWCEDFPLQQEVSREELTAWLANKYVPWKRKRRLLQAITLSFPCSAWLHKIGAATSDNCIACHKVSLRQGHDRDDQQGHIWAYSKCSVPSNERVSNGSTQQVPQCTHRCDHQAQKKPSLCTNNAHDSTTVALV